VSRAIRVVAEVCGTALLRQYLGNAGLTQSQILFAMLLCGAIIVLDLIGPERRRRVRAAGLKLRLQSPVVFTLCAFLIGGTLTAGAAWLVRPAVTATIAGDRVNPVALEDRHLSSDARASMLARLSAFPAGKVAVVTLKDRRERAQFGSELAEALRAAGWTVIENHALDSFSPDNRAGVLLVRHAQSNMPNLDALIAALASAKVRHEIVDIGSPAGSGLYFGDIDTSVPVMFIGPSLAPPEPR
jgi:hypothetical protein